jgi:hypothetical protein
VRVKPARFRHAAKRQSDIFKGAIPVRRAPRPYIPVRIGGALGVHFPNQAAAGRNVGRNLQSADIPIRMIVKTIAY